MIANLENLEIRNSISERTKHITEVQDLRFKLVEFMETNETLHSCAQFILQKANTLRHLDISWEEYLAKMKRSYEWVDVLVIICMVIFLGKDIFQILHNSKQENP